LYILKQHATGLGLCIYLGFLAVKLLLLVWRNHEEFKGRKQGLAQFLNQINSPNIYSVN
jgi:hypothetical protein